MKKILKNWKNREKKFDKSIERLGETQLDE